MKVFLIGYEGSQKIVPASKYLTDKYLPKEYFEVFHLIHRGGVKQWTKHVANFLSFFSDKYIILGLDDYLISDHVDLEMYKKALEDLNDEVGCVKLCYCTPEENLEYPVTTQYSIWDREYLISLFEIPPVDTVWEFEIECSRHYFKKVCLHRPCVPYYTNSSLSGRWKGINFEGLKEEDIKYIKENNLIHE